MIHTVYTVLYYLDALLISSILAFFHLPPTGRCRPTPRSGTALSFSRSAVCNLLIKIGDIVLRSCLRRVAYLARRWWWCYRSQVQTWGSWKHRGVISAPQCSSIHVSFFLLSIFFLLSEWIVYLKNSCVIYSSGLDDFLFLFLACFQITVNYLSDLIDIFRQCSPQLRIFYQSRIQGYY